jgi:hypothetical protein
MNRRDQFERCWPLLDASLASFGRTHTKQQVWDRICDGRAEIWTGDDAVILGEYILHPIGLKSYNVWLQGGDLAELKSMHPRLERWARGECDRMIAWGRDGWVRVMDGWENCGTRRAKWLRDVPDYVRATKR